MAPEEYDEIMKSVFDCMRSERGQLGGLDCWIGAGIDKAMVLGYIKGHELAEAARVSSQAITTLLTSRRIRSKFEEIE